MRKQPRTRKGERNIVLRYVVVLLFALVIACHSYAAGPLASTVIYNKNLLPLKIMPGKFIAVSIDDHVADGCWTNAEATRAAVQAELKRNGYGVEGAIPAAYMSLSAAGREASKDICAVNIIVIVKTVVMDSHSVDGHAVTAIDNHIMWIRSMLVATPKAHIAGRIKNRFVKLAQMFLSDIGRERQPLLDEITRHAEGAAHAFWSSYKPE